MSTQLSTASPTIDSPVAESGNSTQSAALRSWATLNVDPEVFDRRKPGPAVPTFVHLSRLIEPDMESKIDLFADDSDMIEIRNEVPAGGRRANSSLGRPLFQIGLAALVAAVAVGAYTFGPTSGETLSSLDPVPSESDPEPAASTTPGSSAVTVDELESGFAPHLAGAQQAATTEADLSIVGTATSDGERIRWTATVRNQGPGIANQPVRVIQTLPADLEFVSSAGSDWSCTFNSGASTITCDLQRDLGVGQRRQLGIVTTDGDAAAGDKLPATIAIVGRNADNDLSNNTINIMAVVAESTGSRSSSARSTGPTSADDNTSADDDNSADDDTSATETASESDVSEDNVEELPKTGAGLTAFLAAAGALMCLTGRRLLQASEKHRPIPIEIRLGR